MTTCVVEEGRDEGGGICAEPGSSFDCDEVPDRPAPARKEVLLSARGRRACSEQGPHPTLNFQYGTSHLWGANNNNRRGWSRKRTSAPQMSNVHGSMPRVALVLRSRRSWPVAPQSCRSTADVIHYDVKSAPPRVHPIYWERQRRHGQIFDGDDML